MSGKRNRTARAQAGTNDQPVQGKRMKQQAENLNKKNSALVFLTEMFAIVVLAVYPLYLNSDRYVWLVKHKVSFFWLVTALYVTAAAIVWFAFMGTVNSTSKTRWYKLLTVADWAALAYLLSMILSCVFSPYDTADLGESRSAYFLYGDFRPNTLRYEGVLTKGFYLVVYLMFSKLFRPSQRVLKLFATSAIILALIGFFQYIGHDIFKLYPYDSPAPGVLSSYPYAAQDIIFRTTLGNVDILSAYVGLVVPFFGLMYVKSKDYFRFVHLAAFVSNFMLMILGGADGGKVGVLAAMVLVLAFIITDRTAIARLMLALGLASLSCVLITSAQTARSRFLQTGGMSTFAWDWENSKMWVIVGLVCVGAAAVIRFLPIRSGAEVSVRRFRVAALVTLGVIAVTGVVGLELVGSRIDDTHNVIHQARQVMHGNMEDHFGSGRGAVWKRTIPVIAENPIFGTGPDTFEFSLGPYQQELIELTNTGFDKAHNELLEIAVCSGLVGVAAFMTLFVAAFVIAVPKLHRSNWLMASSVAALGFFVQSLFGVSVPIVTPLFFAMLGIMVATATGLKPEPDADSPPADVVS